MKEMTGKTFGKWTVLRISDTKKHNAYAWLCRCECGVERDVLGSSLRNGFSKSCGLCWRPPRKPASPRKTPTEVIVRVLIGIYKRSAKMRGLVFSLKTQEIEKFLFQNCFYCASPPLNKKVYRNVSIAYNGIDRIDNERGYAYDNCVTCCKICNNMKKDLSINDFLAHVRKIHNNQ